MSDIDTAVVDSLKALDPKRPIREADSLLSLRFASDDPKRASLPNGTVIVKIMLFLKPAG